MLFYRAALPLSHQTLTFVSGLIRAHRKQAGPGPLSPRAVVGAC